MKREPSKYICARCGVAIRLWFGGPKKGEVWKHCASGYGRRSCGKRPIIVERKREPEVTT